MLLASPVFAQVVTLSGVQDVAAGAYHACALKDSGAVKCWGNNESGQVGDTTSADRAASVPVPGLESGAISLSMGFQHSCALMLSGTVKCWGLNTYGQLGDGTTVSRAAPVDVQGLPAGIKAISAGDDHTCALTAAGTVMCWGRNDLGQLGDGSTTARSVPADVAGLGAGVAAIAAGSFHSCAVTGAGGVACWGRNANAQLGDGSTLDRYAPVNVSGLPGSVSSLAAGAYHTCALTTAGGVACWGYNGEGQVGDGSAVQRLTPVTVTGLASGAAAISAGWLHTCAVVGGAARCWGDNQYGQVGDATVTDRLSPVAVTALPAGVATFSAGGYHTCARLSSGAVKCWGRNDFGQVGDGSNTNRSVPVNVRDTFFQSQSGVPLNSLRTSNAVTPTGFATPAAISVSNGEYSIGCTGSFTAAAGQLSPGNAICVRHVSSNQLATAVTTTLSVGSAVETFTSRTVAPLQIVNTTVPQASLGAGYSQTLFASGGTPPVTFALLDGTLPPGIILSAAGTLSGTPTAPGTFGFSVRASDSAGQTADAQYSLSVIADSTPDAFAFPSQRNVPLNSLRVSAAVTPSGFNAPVSVSVANGMYSIGCSETFTSSPGQLSPGNAICVRHISSNLFSTSVVSTLTLGTVSATFSSQTAAPLEFFSTSLPNAAAGSPYSQSIALSGGTPPVTVALSSGSLPPGITLSPAGVLSGTPTAPGRFSFRLGASDSGGQSAAAPFTLEVLDADPDPFGFLLQQDVPANSVRISNTVTLGGFSVAAPLTVDNGEYSINCTQAFQSSPTVVSAGTSVCVRHVASPSPGGINTTTLTVAGRAGTFTSVAGSGLVAGLTVGKSGPGSGRIVVLQGGIDCGSDCEEGYPAGVPVTLVATPDPTSVFEGWSGACSGTGECRLTMSAARSVEARFGLTPFESNVRAVVTGYYQTILGRSPDAEGLAFWSSEANRVVQLGADIREVFYVMAMQFFASPEYTSRATGDGQFLTDLYRTFFVREPDAEGLAYWLGELAGVGSRSALLNSFLFSQEFANAIAARVGATPVRPEVDLTMDLFRGVFGRLPDSEGFRYWRDGLRVAQCQGPGAVSDYTVQIADAFFGSAEYALRGRSSVDFMGDVYNTYLRRGPGGDSSGFNFWVGQIPARGPDGVRAAFVPSAEFQARVAAIVEAGCAPPE